jgi:hypothetical protein
LKITWTSVTGRIYVVEYTPTLPAQWTTIITVPSHGDTTTYSDSDPTRLSRPTGFYRVGLQP